MRLIQVQRLISITPFSPHKCIAYSMGLHLQSLTVAGKLLENGSNLQFDVLEMRWSFDFFDFLRYQTLDYPTMLTFNIPLAVADLLNKGEVGGGDDFSSSVSLDTKSIYTDGSMGVQLVRDVLRRNYECPIYVYLIPDPLV